jgi:hypothetical protein
LLEENEIGKTKISALEYIAEILQESKTYFLSGNNVK